MADPKSRTPADPVDPAAPVWHSTIYGVSYTGPDIEHATQVKLPNGQIQNVVYNPDGTRSYVNVDPGTQSPTPTPGQTQAESSARAIIDGALGLYGLSSLSNWAWQKHLNGETDDQIWLELPDTPEFKTRFPAYEALAKSGHAMSPGDMVQYEKNAAAIMKAAGLPAGFYDSPDDYAGFLTNNVALPELQDRVKGYQTLLFQEPPEVLDAWQNLYGMSQGDALAYYIDPTKALPLIQQKNAAAQAAGWSNATGFGAIDRTQAEAVGNLGLSEDALRQGFGALGGLSGLYTGLQGTTETDITKDTALGAGFFDDAEAKAEIERRKNERLATFQGGGGVVTTQAGAIGAGTAR